METTSEHPHKLVRALADKVYELAEADIAISLADAVGVYVDRERRSRLSSEAVVLAEKIVSRMRWNEDDV